ncbi:ubiquinol-cytochrome-c reductase complex assembly factor 1 [Episyrphus balteatus]|uniref:ubiquinol-cytochrome-c reductase complex assembly factor 1 n=1 Tax=Episyrphus balteatus TaxID=286459 RepID=UPI0024866A55|nr:ubiquinol-cytochrome-c reductase complex assembly factor 1 [Episyrphus balteatus]
MLYQRALCTLANTKYTLPVISQFSQLHSNSLRINAGHQANQLGCSPLKSLVVPAAATYATDVYHAKANNNDVGILKRVLKKVGFAHNSKSRLRVCSRILYESVADKINYLNFFEYFNLPNTFNSWFLVTELHVWMILVRAMAEGSEAGEDGRFLRNSIVEAMWSDVNTRAKKLGAQNPSRTRAQIETMSEQFQAALIGYDEGIMCDDRVLAGAIWRRFFEMKCDDFCKLEALVIYVRQQIHMLDHLSREEFLVKPKIPWLDLEKDTLKKKPT